MPTTINSTEASYRDPAANLVYELLFCDKPSLFAAKSDGLNNYPWSVLLSDDLNLAGLHQIIHDENLETRHKILAHNKLTKAGIHSSQKELLGVVIEVAVETGLDVVAAYKDGTAHYINTTGKMIIWDAVNPASEDLIRNLFRHSQNIVQKIGAWDSERRPHPEEGMARLNFLVSDGLYFGEAPQNVLFADAQAKPVLMAPLKLMQYLTETVLESNA